MTTRECKITGIKVAKFKSRVLLRNFPECRNFKPGWDKQFIKFQLFDNARLWKLLGHMDQRVHCQSWWNTVLQMQRLGVLIMITGDPECYSTTVTATGFRYRHLHNAMLLHKFLSRIIKCFPLVEYKSLWPVFAY